MPPSGPRKREMEATMRAFRVRSKGVLGFVVAMSLVVAACGNGEDAEDEPVDTEDGEQEQEGEEEEAEDGEEADAGPFTIGVSNGFTASEWRTQMIDNLEEAAAEYQEEGLVDELIIENDDVDEAGQIEQIRNLVNAGVDAIIINPNSPDALNAAFEEAAAEGVKIYAVDQAVTSEAVTNVVIDQSEWAKISAEWLAEQVGEGGEIVMVNGIAGHPANEARVDGATSVFEEAGVEVVAEANADWSQAEGQSVMQELLSQYGDEIDGVWAQDGTSEGVLNALIDADRLDLVTTGEARAGYLRKWEENDVDTIGVINPPGVGVTAMRVALQELQGGTIDESQLTDGNTLLLPLPEHFTNENLDEALERAEGEPDGYSLDMILSEEEVAEWFE
ncbi:MAG: substrate-binding domain-containing protein [Actinomycetota bacterium]